MPVLRIHEPFWQYRAVGVRPDRLDDDIEILYRDKRGDRVWPGRFVVDPEKVHTYKTMFVGPCRDVELKIIPIVDLIPVGP
jgi:hypothetical protein